MALHIPAYWARADVSEQGADGRRYRFNCWGWSDTSTAEARLKADERARELAAKVRAGMELRRYPYGDRPLREEIVERLGDYGGGEAGVVTRNGYGALVLNAPRALFADVDLPDESGASIHDRAVPGGLLGALFGGRRAEAPDRAAPLVERVAEWARTRPELGVRVYRTAGGLRCLVTNAVFDPGDPDALNILRALQSDPLYVRLCQSQGSFRARLTPKPWRCGLAAAPAGFPWERAGDEARFRQWQREYERAAAGYAVCRLVRALGPAGVHPEIAPVLEHHDRTTGVGSERQLA